MSGLRSNFDGCEFVRTDKDKDGNISHIYRKVEKPKVERKDDKLVHTPAKELPKLVILTFSRYPWRFVNRCGLGRLKRKNVRARIETNFGWLRPQSVAYGKAQCGYISDI